MTAPAPRAKDVVAWAPMVTIKGVTRIDAWNIRPRRADVLASLGRDNWRRYYEPKGWRIARVRITEITKEDASDE